MSSCLYKSRLTETSQNMSGAKRQHIRMRCASIVYRMTEST